MPGEPAAPRGASAGPAEPLAADRDPKPPSRCASPLVWPGSRSLPHDVQFIKKRAGIAGRIVCRSLCESSSDSPKRQPGTLCQQATWGNPAPTLASTRLVPPASTSPQVLDSPAGEYSHAPAISPASGKQERFPAILPSRKRGLLRGESRETSGRLSTAAEMVVEWRNAGWRRSTYSRPPMTRGGAVR